MLTLIGCGNPTRSDDGVGVAVAKRLAARLRRHPIPQVQVFDCGTAGMEVMFAARGSDALIIIDASRSGSEPGALFEVPGEEVRREREARTSSLTLHDFRWEDALAAGAKIFGASFPKAVSVYLVEAATLEFGLELSEPVRAASELLYERLLDRIAEYAAARHRDRPSRALLLRDGHLLVDAGIGAEFFDGCAAVLPFEENGAICLMPIDEQSGGLLLKLRNAQGDRVVDLGEVLRRHGWPERGEQRVEAIWNPRLGALALNPLSEPSEHACPARFDSTL